MKVWSNGRLQGARFVGSTVAGEAIGSAPATPASRDTDFNPFKLPT